MVKLTAGRSQFTDRVGGEVDAGVQAAGAGRDSRIDELISGDPD